MTVKADEIIARIKAERDEQHKPDAEDRHPTECQHRGSILSVENFYAYMPMHNYIYAPTRETWPASSVNARVAPVKAANSKAISASQWIDRTGRSSN